MKKNIFNIICTIVCVLSAAACTADFEYYNTNKHEATEDQMEKDNLRTGAFFRQLQRSVVIFSDGTYADSDYQISVNLLADSYAGYLAPTLASNNGTHTGSYYMTENWCKAMYDQQFTYAMPAWQQLTNVAEDAEAYLATVVKVAAMHRVTDYYGPIPYCNFGVDIQSTYDSQEDVYNKFFEELDEAIDFLTEYAVSSGSILSNYDYVYGGDATEWVKFANSLRLRLAMRVVYANESLAKTEAEKSINNTIGVMTSASDIASLKHSADLVYHHPLWEINKNFNDGDTQVNASIESFMNGYNDPRMPYYFETAADGQYHGVRNGIHTTTWSDYRNSAGYVSAPAANSSSTEIVWMAPSEVYFLRAEGALRGWSMGGDAKSLYEEGISMSFTENGAGDASSYMADATSKPADFVDNTNNGGSCNALSTITIAWDDSADFEEKLERIITQKWIALYPNGPEGWAEFRRTGYPKLLPVLNNDSNGAVNTDEQIRRVPFSTDEYRDNPAGVAAGVTALGGQDNAGTKLWWDKKN
ncbi:MAG: SusD/RagB family nutrient-binding outer membrane lipoprotein [Bacteroidales bacterium]|nr:SusD/RagB family nutrient-binding outer membrane lipoprotein [Bacteroidales bacterium]